MVYTKVARIISDTDLILAAGSEDGVKEGMEFVIFQLGEPIPDPETGESLGQLELVKGRVVAAHVQPKITVATTTARQVTRRVPSIFETLRPATGGYVVTETVRDHLKVEGAVAVEVDPTVRVGDKARSVD